MNGNIPWHTTIWDQQSKRATTTKQKQDTSKLLSKQWVKSRPSKHRSPMFYCYSNKPTECINCSQSNQLFQRFVSIHKQTRQILLYFNIHWQLYLAVPHIYFSRIHSTGCIIKLMKGKALRKHSLHEKQQPRFYWSCSSVVMNDATPLTPPSAWA